MKFALYFRRVQSLLPPEQIRRQRVAVVGLGSGGARVAVELGRLGVQLFLVEKPDELLLEHNVVRHVLGYRSVGQPKLRALAKHLRTCYPFARVRTWGLDVVRQEALLERRLRRVRPDALAVCTDNEESKHAINGLAVRLGIPQVGAGVYDAGVGGEVYVTRPGRACYGCIAEALHLQPRTDGEKAIDYNAVDPAELTSTCALNMDIEQIALIQARWVLQVLLDGSRDLTGIPPKINLCVFANRSVPGVFSRPLHAEFFEVPSDPACLCCGRTGSDPDGEADRILASLGVEKKSN